MPAKKAPTKVTKKVAAKVAKPVVKPTAKPAATAAKVGTTTTPRATRGTLSAPIYSLLGRSAGTQALPKELFGAEVNQKLLAQALRVYLNNQKGHFSNTKTRGEVKGSTRKLFKQKGTGRARHGAVRAPIFVGGGIALGPKARKVVLDLPKKMRKAALISALSLKAKDNQVGVIAGLEKATGKTKEMANFLDKLEKRDALIVTDGNQDTVQKATRNLPKVGLSNVDSLNVLDVVKHQNLILTKEAILKLQTRIQK